MTSRIILTTLLTAIAPSLAQAHGGHIGELAGHSHWVGVAALAGAALVAGIAAWAAKKDRAAADKEDERSEGEDLPEGETAQ